MLLQENLRIKNGNTLINVRPRDIMNLFVAASRVETIKRRDPKLNHLALVGSHDEAPAQVSKRIFGDGDAADDIICGYHALKHDTIYRSSQRNTGKEFSDTIEFLYRSLILAVYAANAASKDAQAPTEITLSDGSMTLDPFAAQYAEAQARWSQCVHPTSSLQTLIDQERQNWREHERFSTSGESIIIVDGDGDDSNIVESLDIGAAGEKDELSAQSTPEELDELVSRHYNGGGLNITEEAQLRSAKSQESLRALDFVEQWLAKQTQPLWTIRDRGTNEMTR